MGKEKKDLEFDGEIALFEGKPFSGFCVEHVDSIGEHHKVRSSLDVFGSEGYYKNGKKDGLWEYWYPEGQMRSEENYENGIENGVTTCWYQNGQKLSEKNY